DGGMASALSDADARRWASIGVEAIHPAQGVQALAEVLASGLPQVTVMPISWRRYAASLGEREAPRLLSDLVDADRVRPSGAAADARAPRTDLAARLAAAPEARRPAVLLAFVTEQALAALGLPSSHAIDPHQGLRDIGLDSLMAIEL